MSEHKETERDERGGARTSDIIVTGRSLDKESTALPVQVLAGEDLAHRRQGGLGDGRHRELPRLGG